MNPSEERLYEVTEVAIVKHSQHGVLLLHSNRRQWHLPDSTISVDEEWDRGLQRGVETATGIDDLTIDSVLKIQNFGPGVVNEHPQYGVFFLCRTDTAEVKLEESVEDDDYCWVTDIAEIEDLEIFHPLIKDLIAMGLEASS